MPAVQCADRREPPAVQSSPCASCACIGLSHNLSACRPPARGVARPRRLGAWPSGGGPGSHHVLPLSDSSRFGPDLLALPSADPPPLWPAEACPWGAPLVAAVAPATLLPDAYP
eukprot:EG_transcript_12344